MLVRESWLAMYMYIEWMTYFGGFRLMKLASGLSTKEPNPSVKLLEIDFILSAGDEGWWVGGREGRWEGRREGGRERGKDR